MKALFEMRVSQSAWLVKVTSHRHRADLAVNGTSHRHRADLAVNGTSQRHRCDLAVDVTHIDTEPTLQLMARHTDTEPTLQLMVRHTDTEPTLQLMARHSDTDATLQLISFSTDWLEQCLEGERKGTQIGHTTSDRESQAACPPDSYSKKDVPRPRRASKPHSTPLTLKWLEDNYEIAEGVCIPRNALYLHYLDFCEKHDTQPVNAASFGKIIRQQFHQITTRRLGTRGQSKYHYYGIGVKETSLYYELTYSAKGLQSSADGKKDVAKQIITYSPRSKLGTLLPNFPDIQEIKLSPNIPEDKVLTFLMMYRTHCQRILDTVIRANFDEVQNFLLHFWQGMPQHIVHILDFPPIVTLVGVCDTILYKAIANVLMPSVLQALPDSLTQVIRKFAKQLDGWLTLALEGLPENLLKIKFDLARRFAQVLRRQTSLNHLCQAARTVINSTDITSQMLEDWLNIDLNSIVKQTLYTMDNYLEKDHQIIFNLCGEFERLIEEQAPIEMYIKWLDCMIESCVIQPSQRHPGSLRRIARQFLLMWTCFGTRVIRDMTLHSAPSFGSFHLLHLMFDDYVLYLVEGVHSHERAMDFMKVVRGEESKDLLEEIVLPEPVLLKDQFLTSAEPGDHSMVTSHQIERGSVITSGRDALNQMIGNDFNLFPQSPLTSSMLLSMSNTSTYSPPGALTHSTYSPPGALTHTVPQHNPHIQLEGSSTAYCSNRLVPPGVATDYGRYPGQFDWSSRVPTAYPPDTPANGSRGNGQNNASHGNDYTTCWFESVNRSLPQYVQGPNYPGGAAYFHNETFDNTGKRKTEDCVVQRHYKRTNRDYYSYQNTPDDPFS
ncbi:hypothetical protein ScPMuIL_002373 [Solemya velum]